jgi:hypothetical protein
VVSLIKLFLKAIQTCPYFNRPSSGKRHEPWYLENFNNISAFLCKNYRMEECSLSGRSDLVYLGLRSICVLEVKMTKSFKTVEAIVLAARSQVLAWI